MVALRCGEIVRQPMSLTRNKTKTIDLALFADVAATFFG
jgi:hypothetical protein